MKTTTLRRMKVSRKLKSVAGSKWNRSMAGDKQKPSQEAGYSRM